MTSAWEEEYRSFRRRDMSAEDYVYVWADGVHFRVRLEDDRLCTLVLLGVHRAGTKELIAVENGYRESAGSWASLLRDLKRPGLQAPVLAIGDGALGFWLAVPDVWPETREQRCWVHRLARVLDKLPTRLQAKAKRALHEITCAECREDAEAEIERFREEYGAKYPKVVESLRRDEDSPLSFFDFPAEHRQHLRTTNALEPTFATAGCVSESPRAPVRGRRPSSWLSSCSTWRRNAGGESPRHTPSLRPEKEYHSPTELGSRTRPDRLADPQFSAIPRGKEMRW